PLMEQYFKVKGKHPQTILLFRVGDFYETFGEDAIKVSKVLGIVLTARNNGGSDIELAGFPYHSLDVYLPKLVRGGYRVAICEQLEKPSKEKKIVKRGVTEIVTPGVIIDDQMLNHRENNFLAALHFGKESTGIAFLDLSTGEFLVSAGDFALIDKLMQTYQPSEVIFAKEHKKTFQRKFGDQFYTYPLDEWIFANDYAVGLLLDQFQAISMKGYGISELPTAQIAAGAILHYLKSTENSALDHLGSIQRIHPENFVWMDRFTIRNLELIHSNHATGVPLIDVLDQTTSPMGARLMRKWVLMPLNEVSAIEERLDAVSIFATDRESSDLLAQALRKSGDLERLISKISMGKAQPRDLGQLAHTLSLLPGIQETLLSFEHDYLSRIADALHPCAKLQETIGKTIVSDPPTLITKGGAICDGCHSELDELRHIIRNSKELLLQIQTREAEATGITNLKIGYNNVFGYYLEVTNKYKNQGLIPEEWVRKQTLTGSERYITDELKTLETKILGAQEKALELEMQLFHQLMLVCAEYIEPIQHDAQQLARLDCLLSFASLANRNEYNRPTISSDDLLKIVDGRHPVIESQLDPGEHYVPNSVQLDHERNQILMITGPNMSGKSAVLRQTAIITIMAQMGSFVPAQSAHIGIVDKIFTRVGASDNISSGESTFMVEMNETASIMNNITPKSLVLLDEIGRGTSTYDGISIAWSIAEYLHNNPGAQARTLFATHYHELNELATQCERIQNFHISTKESGKQVIFLRKLVPGGSHHSFGIHVARMAGMPASIIRRARVLLEHLEQKSLSAKEKEGTVISHNLPPTSAEQFQMQMFDTEDVIGLELKRILSTLEVNTMTPIECMLKINELKEVLNKEEV
ncbi:MAG: DNA mismatch repair protein MutS, partial [Saprospiraceae bacterium]|nr:DNA mismatch repair protein MutS [Saprospiraceae bacterium]